MPRACPAWATTRDRPYDYRIIFLISINKLSNRYERRAWQDAAYDALYKRFSGTASAPRLAAALAGLEQYDAHWQQAKAAVQRHTIRNGGDMLFAQPSSFYRRVQALGLGSEAGGAGGVYMPSPMPIFQEG